MTVSTANPVGFREAEDFLRALFGPYHEAGHCGFIEVRLIRSVNGKKEVRQRFFDSVTSVLGTWPEFVQANSQIEQFNVYIGVNPRSRRRGKDSDIDHAVAVHADLDEGQPNKVVSPPRFPLEESVIVFSGHGRHFYFLLKEPHEIPDDVARSVLRGVNAAVADALGADHCYDLSRALRLPGFVNWKNADAPVLVKLERCEPHRRYNVSEFDFLAASPISGPAQLPQRVTGVSEPRLSDRVVTLIGKHPTLKLRFGGDPLGLNDGSRSGIDFSIASILSHAGCPFLEIADTLRLAPYNRERQAELTSQYLSRTIERAGKNDADLTQSPSKTVQQAALKASISEAKVRITKWLGFSPGEDLAIDVALAVKLSNDAPGDPVFLIIVGPSSGAKSEIIRGFKDVPGVHMVGSLTARTFASGLDPKRASLLTRLPEYVHTLALKDLGTILAMNPTERGDLLQQLRDIFDGSFRRDWGAGKGSFEWEGRLGLLAGATPAIERELSTLAALGERFLFFRMTIKDRGLQARRALESSGREVEMRNEIREAVASVLEGITPDQVNLVVAGTDGVEVIQAIACALTQARTPVVRDRYDKTIDFIPQPEGPARAAKALKKLSQALAALYGHHSVGERELGVLACVGADSIPSTRRSCLEHLYIQPPQAWLTAKTIGQAIQLPTATATKLLEDLAALKIVDRITKREGQTAAFEVQMKPAFRRLWLTSGLAALSSAHPLESAEEAPQEVAVALSADSGGYAQDPGVQGDIEISR